MRVGLLFLCVVSVAAITTAAVRADSDKTAQPAQVTFSKDVAPILQRSCQTCHRPGSIAPMSRLIQTHGNLNPGEDDPNKPPSLTIASVPAVEPTRPVSLTALVADDGLPKPRPAPKPRPGAIPQAQTNSANEIRPPGLSVKWFEYRGPAKVSFDSTGPIAVSNGQAVATARFAAPGTYVLRATADDGALSTSADVIITAKPRPSAGDMPQSHSSLEKP